MPLTYVLVSIAGVSHLATALIVAVALLVENSVAADACPSRSSAEQRCASPW